MRKVPVLSRALTSLRALAGTLAALLLLLGAFAWFLSRRAGPPPALVGETPSAQRWLAVYFTDPEGSQQGTLRGGPDAELAAAIDQAQDSVDMAIYHLNLWSIRDALLRAHQRGVRVRVVMESDNLFEPEVQDLEQAGVPLLGDRRESLMHHKFTVIDGAEVWTGSMNYSVGSAYFDDNALLRLRSSAVAENYTREFEEMFTADLFGPLSSPDTPHPRLSIEGVEVETLFSPDDGVGRRLVELMDQAQERIDFLAFTFTSDPLGEAMLDAVRRGVRVRGVVEGDQAIAAGSEVERLRDGGVDLRLDGRPGLLHHKLIVIDGRTVVVGSYNFTRSAEEQNDENVLILHGAEVAAPFEAEVERLYALGVP